MNKIYLLFVVFLISFAPQFTYAQNIDSKIDSLYSVKDHSPGFSVAVFIGDEIILEKQYGSANLDYNIPITSETVFDIASIAKQFTAFAILLLEEQGKLELSDPAYQYVDNLPRYQKGDPTIEQLLNQTSGIMEVDPIAGLADLGRNDLLTQSQMMNFILKAKQLNFEPGKYFQYTNANYVLLADIVVKASGKSFADFLSEDVFRPFEMNITTKKSSTYTIVKNRAIGYVEDEGEFYKTHLHSFVYDGDGQVLTNPRDMFKWHMALQKVKKDRPKLYQKMHTKSTLNNGSTTKYGLGVEFEMHNGYEAVGFDGMIKGGFVSKYLYFPKLDIAFFTTQNTFDWDFRERFFKLVDLYVPKKEIKRKEPISPNYNVIKLSKTDLKKYEGDYLFLGNEEESKKIAHIKLKNNKLVVFDEDGDEVSELKPIGNQQFIMFSDKVLTFNLRGKTKEYTFTHYPMDIEAPWVFKEYVPYRHNQNELKEFEGQYFNSDFQISKKIKFENGKLYYYYRNGAWKDEMATLSRDLLEIPDNLIQIKRNENGIIKGFSVMGIYFEKMQ